MDSQQLFTYIIEPILIVSLSIILILLIINLIQILIKEALLLSGEIKNKLEEINKKVSKCENHVFGKWNIERSLLVRYCTVCKLPQYRNGKVCLR